MTSLISGANKRAKWHHPTNGNNNGTAPAASSVHQYFASLVLLGTAHAASSAGFHATRRSTLTALSEIAARYIESIGVASGAAATLAGRTEATVHDLLFGLSEMGVEFSEMREWAQEPPHVEAPVFARDLPVTLAPVVQSVQFVEPIVLPAPLTGQDGTNTLAPGSVPLPRPVHVPTCLPAYPARRTYAFTPVEQAQSTVDGSLAIGARKRKVEENRALETALVSLHAAVAKGALECAIEAEKELRMPLPPQLPPPTLPRNFTAAVAAPRARSDPPPNSVAAVASQPTVAPQPTASSSNVLNGIASSVPPSTRTDASTAVPTAVSASVGAVAAILTVPASATDSSATMMEVDSSSLAPPPPATVKTEPITHSVKQESESVQ